MAVMSRCTMRQVLIHAGENYRKRHYDRQYVDGNDDANDRECEVRGEHDSVSCAKLACPARFHHAFARWPPSFYPLHYTLCTNSAMLNKRETLMAKLSLDTGTLEYSQRGPS
jgi:hypothetical protein